VGHLTPKTARAILARHPVPVPVFIETGTHQGNTLYPIREACLFQQMHSIELSVPLYERALAATRTLHDFGKGLFLHHGDSAQILPSLVSSIQEPVFFWLDAHWYDSLDVSDVAPTPLMMELRAIASRGSPDIVVVDDVECFGKKWSDGPGGDWSHIRQDVILQFFGARVVESYVASTEVGQHFVLHLKGNPKPFGGSDSFP
jgi:hypothetical protein